VCPAASLKTVSSIRSSVTDTVLPQTIFLCGLPRTGSTVVFNIARLLVTQVDARSISGWYATKNKKGKTVLDLAVKARRVHFSVVKTHYLTDRIVKFGDKYIFTHRNPLYSTCSGDALDVKAGYLDLKVRQQRSLNRCLEWKKLQSGLYHKLSNKPIIDIDYERVLDENGVISTAWAVARFLGIHEFVNTTKVAREIFDMKPPHGSFAIKDSVTLLHGQHRAETHNECLQEIAPHLYKDRKCFGWIRQRGRFTF